MSAIREPENGRRKRPHAIEESLCRIFLSEPFVHLAGLTHKSALDAWGAFYFRVKDSGEGGQNLPVNWPAATGSGCGS